MTNFLQPPEVSLKFAAASSGDPTWQDINADFFMRKLLGMILQAANDPTQPIKLCFDLDLTLFGFHENPENVTIDPLAKQALESLLKLNIPNLEIVAITGRSIEQAQSMLQGLSIKIIGDHGLVEVSPDRTRREFPIPESVVTAKDAAYSELQAALRELPPNQQQVVVLEVKDYSVGFKVVDPSQFADGEAQALISKLKAIMGQHTISGLSAIASESAAEAELRPEAGKETGMEYFLGIGTEAFKGQVVFFCDSLGPKGTDRKAAEMVIGLVGDVVQVTGERDGRFQPADGISPSALCYKASGLGGSLVQLVHAIEARLAPKPPAPALVQK